ncbi:MAG TPA: SpoIID/LytB domain-containing protein, partial [Vicinamibacterales bacterium]
MTRRELLALLAVSVPGSRLPVPGSPPRTLKVGVARGSAYSIRLMPLEEYVSGVLAGEALRGSAPTALDALAIAIRTYALANLGRHRSDGFDLCDQT